MGSSGKVPSDDGNFSVMSAAEKVRHRVTHSKVAEAGYGYDSIIVCGYCVGVCARTQLPRVRIAYVHTSIAEACDANEAVRLLYAVRALGCDRGGG